MSTVQEFTLADKQATVAGITRLINRHLRGSSLRRVEVRFSTQASQPFDPNVAMPQIKGLLREHGLAAVEVSVRALELAIDDAAGEHRVRLLHKEMTQPAAGAATVGNRFGGRFEGLLSHLLPARLGRAPQAGQGSTQVLAPQPQPVAPQPPAEPALPQKRAVELLKQALAVAVRDEGPMLGDVAVQSLHITVRQAGLHQALDPLVARDAAGAGLWAARLLAEHRIAAAPGLRVAYTYKPPQQGEHTEVVVGSDVEIHLSREALATVPAPRTVPAVRPAPVPTHDDAVPMPARWPAQAAGLPQALADPCLGTIMPMDCVADSVDEGATIMPRTVLPQAALTVRVLGTTECNFDTPFELHFDALPATFDRATLQRGGFAARHGAALRVASQSCPLVIDRDADGGLVLRASARPGTTELPMYFRADNQAGVLGTVLLRTRAEVLVVNGPLPLVDPASGERLHPLVIALALAGAAPPARHHRLPPGA